MSNIYQKPFNKYLYLPPTSQHQSHVLMNVIRSELDRYRLYCVREVDFYIVRTKFKERLRLRGYSNSYLDQIFQPTLDRQRIEDKVFKVFDTNRSATIEKIETQSFLQNLTQTDQFIRNNLIKFSLNNNIVVKPADKFRRLCYNYRNLYFYVL